MSIMRAAQSGTGATAGLEAGTEDVHQAGPGGQNHVCQRQLLYVELLRHNLKHKQFLGWV